MSDRKRLYTLLRVAHTWAEQHLSGWTEDDYRGLLQRHGATQKSGKFSASTMTDKQLESALTEFRQKGFKPTSKTRTAEWRAPRIAKLNAMWLDMHRAGLVRNRSEQAMQAWCKNNVRGLNQLQWATSAQLNQAVEMMKQMHARIEQSTR